MYITSDVLFISIFITWLYVIKVYSVVNEVFPLFDVKNDFSFRVVIECVSD